MNSKRWVGYGALTLIVAVLCCCLGAWQLARRNEVLTENSRIEKNFDASPIPLTDALPHYGSYSDSNKWLPVSLAGKYLFDKELLVRNRPFNGMPGFEILTPLLLDNGSVFIVDRGWVPTGSQHDEPDTVPSPPAGNVTVVARLKPSEPTLFGRSATGNQIATIHLPDVANTLTQPSYTGAYGLMAKENPAPLEHPYSAPKPETDEGPHLSYAFQWFVFAVFAIGAYGYAIRQEYRASRTTSVNEAQQQRHHVKNPRQPSDSEIEDRILDSLPLYAHSPATQEK